MYKILFLVVLLFSASTATCAADAEYKVYFGLSKPNDGAVSLAEWETYEAEFANSFAGFNVAETIGYYKGAKERSRLITLIMDTCREPKLDAITREYAKRFQQESVLIVKTKIESWKGVSAEETTEYDDKCEG